MTSFREIAVIAAITAPVDKGTLPDLKPLIEYLQTADRIGLSLRRHIAEWLDESAHSTYVLKLHRRDTRRVLTKNEVDRDVTAFNRVEELTDAVATDALVEDILNYLPGWTLKHSENHYLLQRGRITEIRLRVGYPLSRRVATQIAAFQINKHYDSVKKMIAAIDAIRRET